MLRSAFLKSLLVIALLFAQQGALTHTIAHMLAEQSQDQPLPHDQQCDLCAAYAQVGSAVGSNAVHFDFAAPAETTLSSHFASFRSTAFAAFAARAPPRSA
jgi:predicted dienelactone hydrolase